MESITIFIALMAAATFLIPRVIIGIRKKKTPNCGDSCTSCCGQYHRVAGNKRQKATKVLFVLLAIVSGLVNAVPRSALAVDTVETWDVGATDVDFYLGLDGLGLGKHEKTVYGDIMLGYGLVERFSAYVGTTLQGNEYFSDGSAGLYLGIFGTPVDTDHFDLDLFLDVSAEGSGFEQFALSPALELNIDLDPQMDSWGIYLRVPFPLQGRKLSSPDHEESDDFEASFHLESTLGTYYTIAEIHQILLEYNMGFHPKSDDGERDLDVGGLALGYNVLIIDSLELINQVFFDIPQDDESTAWGFMIGLIATMPSAATK
ncbi:MAG: hypothetical protein GY847_29960 [Proteobacteria bacterium]|nr:hypothetical protein [Pseudomonadota bacterium]